MVSFLDRLTQCTLGVTIAGLPLGALIGAVLATAALELNVQGLVTFDAGLNAFDVSISGYIAAITVIYVYVLVIDWLIVTHGISTYWRKLQNDGRRCPSCQDTCQRMYPCAHCYDHAGGAGSCCAGVCGSVYARCILWCGCCLGATFYACVGTVLLWLGFFVILLQIVASVTIGIIFLGILSTCPEATKFVSEHLDLANRTAQEIRNFFHTSGVKVGLEAVARPPVSIDLVAAVERFLAEAGDNASDFEQALNEFCAHFDGDLLDGCLLIATGALVAIVAQVIVMIYQSKYLTMWWYETNPQPRARASSEEEEGAKKESNLDGKDSIPHVGVVVGTKRPPAGNVELVGVPILPSEGPHQAPFPS